MASPETLSDPIYIDAMPTFIDPERILRGTSGDDVLKGDRRFIMVFGEGGDDQITGGKESNELFGDDGDDVVTGNVANDEIRGGQGKDSLLGQGGRDVLYGDRGQDTLGGGEGDDVLFGGAGSDRLIGDAGADGFALEFNSNGVDRIRDFEDGIDKLAIMEDNPYSSEPEALEAFINDLTITQRGNSTVIKQEGQAVAVLANVDATTITLSDFAPIIIAV